MFAQFGHLLLWMWSIHIPLMDPLEAITLELLLMSFQKSKICLSVVSLNWCNTSYPSEVIAEHVFFQLFWIRGDCLIVAWSVSSFLCFVDQKAGWSAGDAARLFMKWHHAVHNSFEKTETYSTSDWLTEWIPITHLAQVHLMVWLEFWFLASFLCAVPCKLFCVEYCGLVCFSFALWVVTK